MLPTLVHQDVAKTCPDGDIRIICMLGLLMGASGLWQCILFANAARITLSPDGKWGPTPIAIGFLIASIVLLVDAIVFIGASWHAHGLAEVERTYQFKLPSEGKGKAKHAAAFGGRFVMAVLVSQLMATVAGLLAFEKEINQLLERNYLAANGDLLAEINRREASQLEQLVARQRELTALIPQLEAQERDLRTLNLDPKIDETALRLANQHVSMAQSAKAAADRHLQAIRASVSRADWNGQDRVSAAARESATAGRALEDARKRVQDLVNGRAVEAQRKEALAATRLTEVTARKREIEQEIASLRIAYDQRFSNREAAAKATAQRDPRHVAREDGLLARLKALHELSKDSVIAYTLFGFDALLMLLELAAVMGKTFTLIPLTYATRIAEQDLIRAVEAGARLKETFKTGKGPVPPAPEPVKPDEKPVVAPPPAPPIDKTTLNGSGERSRRHAPRWRPGSGIKDGEPPTEH